MNEKPGNHSFSKAEVFKSHFLGGGALFGATMVVGEGITELADVELFTDIKTPVALLIGVSVISGIEGLAKLHFLQK